MSPLQTKAAAILFPVNAADPTGRTGVYRYAAATANTAVVLPTAMKGNFLTFKAIGCNARVSVSRGAAALVYAQTSGVGSESAASGASCADGGIVEGIILKTATHLNFICDNATGTVEFYLSEVLGGLGITTA